MNVNGQQVGLSPEQLAKRRFRVGGSDANAIMAGGEKLWNLWEQKCGFRERDDLSGILAVQMGTWTEDFNAFWFERQTGHRVLDRGLEGAAKDREWMTATIDGFADYSVWEAKHVGGRESRETVLSRYQPQLHHNMVVTRTSRAYLSVFEGNSGYWYEQVEQDPIYTEELLEREAQFWEWVQTQTRPPDMPSVAAPVMAIKSYDMTSSNSWAEHAGLWLRNKSAAKLFKSAEDGLKESVPADAADARGHGVVVKRAKNGNLRITETEKTNGHTDRPELHQPT